MTQSETFTLGKEERIKSQKIQDKLFAGGRSRSLSVFPLRAVFFVSEEGELPCSQILVSVPKRHFKRAVKRNRCKRQIREAYRAHKHILTEAGLCVAVAFIWLDDELHPSTEISQKVELILHRIVERNARKE